MIIKTQPSEVESSGILETKKFNIKSDEQQQMLISLTRENLYKEPLLAFIREIAANARDANREVGFHKVPVKITLPNGFDNSIRIKDCGPGISPERMDIYLGYGLSTKRDSNLQTGGFGLGAKSPFSYSEEYTISSTTLENDKKVKRTYFAVKEGTGSTNLIDEIVVRDPNEKTGVEIAVPIKKNDMYRVKDIIKNLFCYWDVKPEISPSKELLINDAPEILIDDPFFSLVSKKHNSDSPGILLDGFYYSIDKDIDSLELYNNDQLYISGASILFKFNTGEIDLAVSRDNVRFSKLTIKAIKERIEYVHQNLRSLIVKNIETSSNYDSAMLLFSKMRACFSSYIKYVHIDNVIAELFSKIYWNKVLVNSKIETKDIGRWCECYVYTRGQKRRYQTSSVIDYGNNTYSISQTKVIYLSLKEDIDRKVIDHLFKEDDSIREIKVVCTPAVPTSVFFADEIAKNPNLSVEYDQILLNHLNFPKLEDIKIPETVKVKKQRIGSDSNYEHLVGRELTVNYKASSYLLGEPKRIANTGGIYILLDGNKRNEYIIQGFFEEDFTKDYLSSFFRDFLDNKEIYAFTKTRAAHLTNDWVPFGKAVKDKFLSILNKDLSLFWENSLFSSGDFIDHRNKEEYFELLRMTCNNTKEFIHLNELIEFVDELEKLSSVFEKTKNIISGIRDNLVGYLNLSKFEEEILLTENYPDKLSFLYERINSKYPLLKHLSYCSLQKLDINHVIKYMRSC